MKANMRVVQDGEVVQVNKNLFVILTSLPAPDKKFNLTEDQKYWYKYFGKQLIESKKLTKPDLVHLHRLAKSVDYYIQAEKHIDELGYFDGLVQVFKTGATNVSAHVTLRDKMLADIDSLSSHFGFSFKDRSKLKEQTTNPGQLDIWEEYLKQKGAM